MGILEIADLSSLTSWPVLLLSGFVAFYLLLVRKSRAAKMLENVPGPPGLPIVGNALDLNVSNEYLFANLRNWNKNYGQRYLVFIGAWNPYIIFSGAKDVEIILFGLIKYHGFHTAWLFHIPYLMIARVDAVEKILSSPVHIEKSRDYDFLFPWLGTGLLTSKGQKWFQRRKMLTPAFHFKILDDFLVVINEQSQTMVQILKQKYKNRENFDICPYVAHCALDIICETAMGKTIDAQKQSDSEYVQAIYRISELIQHRQVRPWLHPNFMWKLSPSGKDEKRCLDILHGFTKNVIKERKREKQLQKKEDASMPGKPETEDDIFTKGKKRLAFLDLLLDAQEKEGNNLTDLDIREETDTFMFEGHDTTSSAVAWTVFLLASHPQYQAKVHEELDEIFGDDRERPITMQDMTQLKYLEACIKESLRLYPSVPFLARALHQDLPLDDKVTIPAGTTAFIMPFQLHRDPEVFPEPETFLPDRFFPENTIGRNPFAYVPFSAGPRNCIGQKFAMMEEKVLLSDIFRNFTVRAGERREDIVLLAELIMRPKNGLKVNIQPRNKP